MDKIKVSIIGSCVSRDLFEFDIDALNNFKVVNYISRVTNISMMNSFDIELINIDNVEFHKFDEKKALEDINKEHFRILENNDFDLLIIDFIDERHPTYVYGDSFLTYTKFSKNYIDPLLQQGIGRLLKPFSSEMKEYLRDSIPSFINKVLAISKGKPVLLHACKYALTYINQDGVLCEFDQCTKEKIDNWNTFLSSIYEQVCVEVMRLGDISTLCIAGGEHKWDLQPFHYDKSYYQQLSTELKLKLNKEK